MYQAGQNYPPQQPGAQNPNNPGGPMPGMPYGTGFPHHQNQSSPSQPPPSHQQQFMQQQQQYQQQQYQQQQQQMLAARDESLLKLKRLDDIGASITKMINTLIQFFDEISKDKLPAAKLKQSKQIFGEALDNLKKVEKDLLNEISQINIASTGHPHEGSLYGARKDYDLSKMQVNLIVNQLNALKLSLDAPIKNDFYDEHDDEEEL
jgi:hypothetical protein